MVILSSGQTVKSGQFDDAVSRQYKGFVADCNRAFGLGWFAQATCRAWVMGRPVGCCCRACWVQCWVRAGWALSHTAYLSLAPAFASEGLCCARKKKKVPPSRRNLLFSQALPKSVMYNTSRLLARLLLGHFFFFAAFFFVFFFAAFFLAFFLFFAINFHLLLAEWTFLYFGALIKLIYISKSHQGNYAQC